MDSLIKFSGTAIVNTCTAFGVLAAKFQSKLPQGSRLTLKQIVGRSLRGAQPPLLSGAHSKLGAHPWALPEMCCSFASAFPPA